MTSKARAALVALLLSACGAAASGPEDASDSSYALPEALVGTWQSEEDGRAERFVLTLMPDGAFTLAVTKGPAAAEAEGTLSLDHVEGNTYFVDVEGGGKLRLVLHDDDHLEYFRQDNANVSLRFVRGR